MYEKSWRNTYSKGARISALRPEDNRWEQATVINHTAPSPMGQGTHGIYVRFDDGRTLFIETSYLKEDGSGV